MVLLDRSLKGVWHEIFDCRSFSLISFPSAPECLFGAISNFYENSPKISATINDVNDTCDKLSPTSMLLDINYCRCRWHPLIKPCPGFSSIPSFPWHSRLISRGWQRHCRWNIGKIPACLLKMFFFHCRKNSKWSQWNTQGSAGKWFIKKPEVENLVLDPYRVRAPSRGGSGERWGSASPGSGCHSAEAPVPGLHTTKLKWRRHGEIIARWVE